MRTTTQTRNRGKPSRPTSSRASTKSTPYLSSRTSNPSQINIAEEPSAPTATNSVTGRRTADITNARIVICINPTMRNTYVSSNHSDLTVDPKHPSNRNRLHHHPSLFESHTKEDSKPRNPSPLSHHPPHPPLPTEKSPKTREKERRNTLPVNKERSKETSTGLSTTSRRSGTEGWKNSPKTKTNPTNTTTKPSETLTKNHMDFRSSWKFRTIDGG